MYSSSSSTQLDRPHPHLNRFALPLRPNRKVESNRNLFNPYSRPTTTTTCLSRNQSSSLLSDNSSNKSPSSSSTSSNSKPKSKASGLLSRCVSWLFRTRSAPDIASDSEQDPAHNPDSQAHNPLAPTPRPLPSDHEPIIPPPDHRSDTIKRLFPRPGDEPLPPPRFTGPIRTRSPFLHPRPLPPSSSASSIFNHSRSFVDRPSRKRTARATLDIPLSSTSSLFPHPSAAPSLRSASPYNPLALRTASPYLPLSSIIKSSYPALPLPKAPVCSRPEKPSDWDAVFQKKRTNPADEPAFIDSAKRQMFWDPEFGFTTKERLDELRLEADLKRRQEQGRPLPTNEAERILELLETGPNSDPLATDKRRPIASLPLIPVPAPIAYSSTSFRPTSTATALASIYPDQLAPTPLIAPASKIEAERLRRLEENKGKLREEMARRKEFADYLAWKRQDAINQSKKEARQDRQAKAAAEAQQAKAAAEAQRTSKRTRSADCSPSTESPRPRKRAAPKMGVQTSPAPNAGPNSRSQSQASASASVSDQQRQSGSQDSQQTTRAGPTDARQPAPQDDPFEHADLHSSFQPFVRRRSSPLLPPKVVPASMMVPKLPPGRTFESRRRRAQPFLVPPPEGSLELLQAAQKRNKIKLPNSFASNLKPTPSSSKPDDEGHGEAEQAQPAPLNTEPSSGSLFAQPAAVNIQASGGSLFAQPAPLNTQASGGSLFPQPAPLNTQPSGGSLFTQPATLNTQASGGSLFSRLGPAPSALSNAAAPPPSLFSFSSQSAGASGLPHVTLNDSERPSGSGTSTSLFTFAGDGQSTNDQNGVQSGSGSNLGVLGTSTTGLENSEMGNQEVVGPTTSRAESLQEQQQTDGSHTPSAFDGSATTGGGNHTGVLSGEAAPFEPSSKVDLAGGSIFGSGSGLFGAASGQQGGLVVENKMNPQPEKPTTAPSTSLFSFGGPPSTSTSSPFTSGPTTTTSEPMEPATKSSEKATFSFGAKPDNTPSTSSVVSGSENGVFQDQARTLFGGQTLTAAPGGGQTTTFSFGQPSAPTAMTTAPPLGGQTMATASNGGETMTTAPGGSQTMTAAPTFSFGQPPATTSPAGGQAMTTAPTFSFGQPSPSLAVPTNANPAAAPSTGTTGLFGQQPSGAPSTPTTTGGTSLFGTPAPPTSVPNSNPFQFTGSSNNGLGSQPNTLFGSQTSAPPAPAPAPASTFTFGAAASVGGTGEASLGGGSGTGGLFGSQPGATTMTTASGANTAGGSVFGSQAAAPFGFGSGGGSQFAFGAPPTTGSLFGGGGGAGAGGFQFGAANATQPNAMSSVSMPTFGTTGATGGGVFGASPGLTTSASASGFGFGGGAAGAAGGGAGGMFGGAQNGTFNFGAGGENKAEVGSGPSVFGGGNGSVFGNPQGQGGATGTPGSAGGMFGPSTTGNGTFNGGGSVTGFGYGGAQGGFGGPGAVPATPGVAPPAPGGFTFNMGSSKDVGTASLGGAGSSLGGGAGGAGGAGSMGRVTRRLPLGRKKR